MNNQTQISPQFIENLTKAIGYTENGGKPDISNPSSGKTGEDKSIFQFEPGTWQAYSQQVFGKSVPLTADNESKVALTKIEGWSNQLAKEGYSQDQIVPMVASMWNAGPGEPNAYSGKFSDGTSSKGVNAKYGVKYDVPGYADKVENYFKQFSKANSVQPQSNQSPVNAVNPNTSKVKTKQASKINAGQMQGLSQVPQQSSMSGLSLTQS